MKNLVSSVGETNTILVQRSLVGIVCRRDTVMTLNDEKGLGSFHFSCIHAVNKVVLCHFQIAVPG